MHASMRDDGGVAFAAGRTCDGGLIATATGRDMLWTESPRPAGLEINERMVLPSSAHPPPAPPVRDCDSVLP